MIKTLISAAIAASSLILMVSADSLAAERRVALVIGNSQYANPGMNLSNPKNDADRRGRDPRETSASRSS